MVAWKEWKERFERINKELDLTKRKRSTLDELYNIGKISQCTYEYFSKEVAEDIAQIEARYKGLTEGAAKKLNKLEEQLKVLEILLATSEMEYAAEGVKQEVYAAESNAFNLGLEATKHELNVLKEVIIHLIPKEMETRPKPASTQTQVENAEPMLERLASEKQLKRSSSEDAIIEQTIHVPVSPKIENPAITSSEADSPAFSGENSNTNALKNNEEPI
jgi:chromosome segregation ATPase